MHSDEVKKGKRFEFGKNWKSFLDTMDDGRLALAELSLREILNIENLQGSTFLDVGCGSGLFSLAARRLGAKVVSFDYDPASVGCTTRMRKMYAGDDPDWIIHEGSILDREFIGSLGHFDYVYSWGVLHHTGAMRQALENAIGLVKSETGCIYLALYNDQGWKSRFWLKIKQLYNWGWLGRWFVVMLFIPVYFVIPFLWDLVRLKDPRKRYREYRLSRGMSRMHDMFDWLGGLPFEVASIDEIFSYFMTRGFNLSNIKTARGSLGCNEFVFTRKHEENRSVATFGL